METSISSTSRSFDGLNRNAGIAALSGGYDARGNLTYDGTRTFSYDILNRLYYKRSTDGSPDIALSYDPEGRLYAYNSGGDITYFLYDGTDLIGEYDGSRNVLRRYVHSSRDEVSGRPPTAGKTVWETVLRHRERFGWKARAMAT